jgi:hypothetical protein
MKEVCGIVLANPLGNINSHGMAECSVGGVKIGRRCERMYLIETAKLAMPTAENELAMMRSIGTIKSS